MMAKMLTMMIEKRKEIVRSKVRIEDSILNDDQWCSLSRGQLETEVIMSCKSCCGARIDLHISLSVTSALFIGAKVVCDMMKCHSNQSQFLSDFAHCKPQLSWKLMEFPMVSHHEDDHVDVGHDLLEARDGRAKALGVKLVDIEQQNYSDHSDYCEAINHKHCGDSTSTGVEVILTMIDHLTPIITMDACVMESVYANPIVQFLLGNCPEPRLTTLVESSDDGDVNGQVHHGQPGVPGVTREVTQPRTPARLTRTRAEMIQSCSVMTRARDMMIQNCSIRRPRLPFNTDHEELSESSWKSDKEYG